MITLAVQKILQHPHRLTASAAGLTHHLYHPHTKHPNSLTTLATYHCNHPNHPNHFEISPDPTPIIISLPQIRNSNNGPSQLTHPIRRRDFFVGLLFSQPITTLLHAILIHFKWSDNSHDTKEES